MLSNALLALSFLPLTLAHFTVDSLTTRGFEEEKEDQFACGGFNTVGQRTPFPIGGRPIQLHLEHPQTYAAVYLAIGNDPKDAFDVQIQDTTLINGAGHFCFGSVVFPDNLKLRAGMNATIQIVTNNPENGSNGGLYQCIDITLDDTPSKHHSCKNDSTMQIQEHIQAQPNGTLPESHGETASRSSSAANAGVAAQVKAVLLVVGAAGLAML